MQVIAVMPWAYDGKSKPKHVTLIYCPSKVRNNLGISCLINQGFLERWRRNLAHQYIAYGTIRGIRDPHPRIAPNEVRNGRENPF